MLTFELTLCRFKTCLKTCYPVKPFKIRTMETFLRCPWSWSGLGCVTILLNSQFYRNSSFVVPVILNNLFRAVLPLWHLLTSSLGKHGPEPESLIRARKGQVTLILLCKRALYCRNLASKVGNMTDHFRAYYQGRLLWCVSQAEIREISTGPGSSGKAGFACGAEWTECTLKRNVSATSVVRKRRAPGRGLLWSGSAARLSVSTGCCAHLRPRWAPLQPRSVQRSRSI